MGRLIEFNTSCAPVFVQRAGLAAIQGAEGHVPGIVAHLQRCRDTRLAAPQATPGVEVAVPYGGMYAFLRVASHNDSLACA